MLVVDVLNSLEKMKKLHCKFSLTFQSRLKILFQVHMLLSCPSQVEKQDSLVEALMALKLYNEVLS